MGWNSSKMAGRDGFYRKAVHSTDSNAVEIRPGERLAIHRENASGGKVVLVIGKNPVGKRGGTSGKWVDGRIICYAYGMTPMFRRFYREIVTRLCHEGDDEQRAWAGDEILNLDHRRPDAEEEIPF